MTKLIAQLQDIKHAGRWWDYSATVRASKDGRTRCRAFLRIEDDYDSKPGDRCTLRVELSIKGAAHTSEEVIDLHTRFDWPDELREFVAEAAMHPERWLPVEAIT